MRGGSCVPRAPTAVWRMGGGQGRRRRAARTGRLSRGRPANATCHSSTFNLTISNTHRVPQLALSPPAFRAPIVRAEGPAVSYCVIARRCPPRRRCAVKQRSQSCPAPRASHRFARTPRRSHLSVRATQRSVCSVGWAVAGLPRAFKQRQLLLAHRGWNRVEPRCWLSWLH